MSKLSMIRVVIILLVLLVMPVFVLAQPTVTVNPSSGKPAAIIKIDGQGFKPEEEVDILIVLGEDEKVMLGTEKVEVVKANQAGAFSVTTGIPINAKPGVYKLQVIGNKGSYVETTVEVLTK